MKHIKSILALAATATLLAGGAEAKPFVSKDGQVAIEVMESAVVGPKNLVFYCTTAKSCRAEEFTKLGDGRMKITFAVGEGNTVVFWEEDNRMLLDHHRKLDSKVTRWDLYDRSGDDDFAPNPIPDAVLSGVLPGGVVSELRIQNGTLTFCPGMGCWNDRKATFHTVGNQLGYAGLLGNTLSIMVGRLDKEEFQAANPGYDGAANCGQSWGNTMYWVSIHGSRNGVDVLDQAVFCDTKKDPGTTAAVKD